MRQTFFITGIGTNIGKTIVTCSLIRQLKELGKPVMAIKPVISGWQDNCTENDTLQILSSLSLPHTQENIQQISPWRYNAPLAPSMAARIEQQAIDYNSVVNFCRHAADREGYLLCEGAGGVMVPLNAEKTTLDLMQDLDFPIILVTGTYLGAISHTLTAISAIEARRLKIHTIIINESENGVLLEDTIAELCNFTDTPIHPLRRVQGQKNLWERTNIVKVIL